MRNVLWMSVLAVALTAPAASAAKGEWIGGGGAGLFMLSGDIGKVFDPGFGGGVFLDYMATENLAVGADIAYNSSKHETDSDRTLSVFNGGGHARWMFTPAGTVMPYLSGGLGFYNSKLEDKSPPNIADASETNFGINGGAGLMFRAGGGIGLGVEGSVHNVFSDPDATTYFNVFARVTFSFSDVTQSGP